MKELIVVLGGNSPRNAEWAQALTKRFELYASVYCHDYQHWHSGVADIDLNSELARLNTYLNGLHVSYSIIAKSAGAIVALKGIQEKTLQPKTLVCIGLPLVYAERRRIPLQNLIKNNTIPTVYIQATNDPMGSGDAVKAAILGHGTYKFVDSDNHDYADLDLISEESMRFLHVN